MTNIIPKIPRLVAGVLLLPILISCTKKTTVGNMESLAGLEAMAHTRPASSNGQNSSRIREMAIRETALSLGAQAGLAWRAKFIDEELTKEARTLDAVFDFNSLILPHNILPPVLLEGRNTLNLADEHSIRVSDRTYKISKQAKFITTPPNWRQYLWMDYKKPEMPNITLLPKNKQEKEVWKKCVTKGWKDGVEQANIILEENIARIKEDFGGMILYRKLLAMNMVSAPFVSEADLGITGDGSQLHIDDRVLRISALPALNTDSKAWRAAVNKDDEILKEFNLMQKRVNQAKLEVTSRAWQPVVTPSDVITKHKMP